jgi:hypothetical protein
MDDVLKLIGIDSSKQGLDASLITDKKQNKRMM